MPRWAADDVDVACESWAYQWVRHFGHDPRTAAQYIGALRCTLGRVRELHDGASSSTDRGHQHWPELFLGTGLLVNLAVQAMSLDNRRVAFAHYVLRWHEPGTWRKRARPVKQAIVAAELRISLAEYYTRRDCAKECVRTVLAIGRTQAAQDARTDWPLPSAGIEAPREMLAAG